MDSSGKSYCVGSNKGAQAISPRSDRAFIADLHRLSRGGIYALEPSMNALKRALEQESVQCTENSKILFSLVLPRLPRHTRRYLLVA